MMNVDVLPEPVDKWCNVEGSHNLLQLVQENPQRHGMLFQSFAQLTMLQQHTQKPTTNQVDLKVLERSIYSDRYCFIENLYRSGKIEGSEYSVLCEWFKFLTQSSLVDLGVDLVVYLRTSPEVAWARVKERAAHSGTEGQVPCLDQLQRLHDLHEEWLMTPHANVPARVLVLDADQDVSFSLQLTKSILKEVLTISVDPKICKDVRSELELLDRKILRQQRLRQVEFGRAIFHERLRHNSLARPRGAHADLRNVSNQVEPEDSPLIPVTQYPLYGTYPKAVMSFGNQNSPTMSLREEPTLTVLSLRFVDDVFEL
jgi:deoxyadenosine/deoxycytidine kinase